MHNDDSAKDEPSLVNNRVMEIVVALFFIAAAAIVIYDSRRLGIGWLEGEGPAPGYFPFYIAVAMGVAGLVTLAQAVLGLIRDADDTFVTRPAFGRVLAVLVPATIFVALIGGIGPIPKLGLYTAAAIFIFGFMLVIGRANPIKAALVSVGVPFVLFLMFEKWFLVPLPKGPIEAMFGY